MFKTKLTRVGGAALLATALVACGDDDVTDTQEPGTIAATAAASSDLSTLTTALDAAGLVSTLDGAGPFTVFAPTNAAFDALGADVVAALLEDGNIDILSRVLTFHVVSGAAAFSEDLSDGQTFTTVEGGELTVGVSGGSVTVNGAEVVTADIEASNGVIHIIDGVLTDNLDLVDVATVEGFSTLVSLVDEQGLTETLRGDNGGDGYTVFAPTNAAFDALSAVPSGDDLTNTLLYHVVPATVESGALSDGQVVGTAYAGHDFTVNTDGSVTLTDESGNTVNVTLTDVPAANGIIHVIDAVLIPTP